MRPLNARRVELRISSDKPEPSPVVLERCPPTRARRIGLSKSLEIIAALLMTAIALVWFFRNR